MLSFESSKSYPLIFLSTESNERYVSMIKVSAKKNKEAEKMNEKIAFSED